MSDDYDAAAQHMIEEHGENAERQIAIRYGDTLRGGDTDAIAYWAGVRNAFAKLKSAR